jgi:hypothetical protein
MRCTKRFGICGARPARDKSEGTPGASLPERHLSYKQIRFWPGYYVMVVVVPFGIESGK